MRIVKEANIKVWVYTLMLGLTAISALFATTVDRLGRCKTSAKMGLERFSTKRVREGGLSDSA
jgi:hypothetical protein